MVVAPALSDPRRERAALERWPHCVMAGRYARVRYVAGPALVSHLRRAAEDIGMSEEAAEGRWA